MASYRNNFQNNMNDQQLIFKWDPKNLNVRTKTVQRLLEPLVAQVTTLANPESIPHQHQQQNQISGRSGKKGSKKAQVLVAAVERSIENFIQRGEEVTRDNPDGRKELTAALDEVRKTGTMMISASRNFASDPTSSALRATMIEAARALLSAVTRLLILADMIDVHNLLASKRGLEEALAGVHNAQNQEELQRRYEALRQQLDRFNKIVGMRANDLLNPHDGENLQRQANGLPPERKSGWGHQPHIFTPKKVTDLANNFDNNDTISLRSAGARYHCHWNTVRYTLLTKTSVRCHKKISIPHRSESQIEKAKPKCGRLYRKFSDRAIILDDESYFPFSHSTMSGNDKYYSSKKSATPASVKYSKKKKFERKVMVWIAIGPKGLSQTLIRKSGYAVSAKTYLKDCIRARLIPYIRANYLPGQYVFWPDQASSHYAKLVLEYLKAENIDFVEKDDNPANVPEIRPIEDFWSCLKRLVYNKGWSANSHRQLINRIKYCLKKIDPNVVLKLASGTKGRFDTVRRKGVIETRSLLYLMQFNLLFRMMYVLLELSFMCKNKQRKNLSPDFYCTPVTNYI